MTNGNSKHSFASKEARAFANHISEFLKNDKDVVHLLPLTPATLFSACRDGLLLCKLINVACPGTIDERQLTKTFVNPKKLTKQISVKSAQSFQRGENNNLMIRAAH